MLTFPRSSAPAPAAAAPPPPRRCHHRNHVHAVRGMPEELVQATTQAYEVNLPTSITHTDTRTSAKSMMRPSGRWRPAHLDTQLHQPCPPQGSGPDWLLSPTGTSNRPAVAGCSCCGCCGCCFGKCLMCVKIHNSMRVQTVCN